MRSAPFAIALMLAAGPVLAQSSTGGVGSAVLRNGYPAGGGAVVLPSPASEPSGPATAATASAATPSITTNQTTAGGTAAIATGGTSPVAGTGGGGRSGGSGRGGSTAGAGGGGASGGGRGGGGNWVLCPPGGSSGTAPFLTGTDLSCAPD